MATEWEVLEAGARMPVAKGAVLVESEEDLGSWEQREDEPRADYAAFQRYLALGTTRTVRRFVREEAALDGMTLLTAERKWLAVAREYAWEQRAGAYDEYRSGLEVAKYEEDRLRLRKERMQMLQAYLRVLAQQVKKMGENPKYAADMTEITAAMKMVMAEMRTEYQDTPQDRLQEQRRDGKVPLSAVAIQEILIRYRQYEEGA